MRRIRARISRVRFGAATVPRPASTCSSAKRVHRTRQRRSRRRATGVSTGADRHRRAARYADDSRACRGRVPDQRNRLRSRPSCRSGCWSSAADRSAASWPRRSAVSARGRRSRRTRRCSCRRRSATPRRLLSEALARDGIEVRLNTAAVRVRVENGEKLVDLVSDDYHSTDRRRRDPDRRRARSERRRTEPRGGRRRVRCRQPASRVDDFLRTTNRRIYAAGDVTPRARVHPHGGRVGAHRRAQRAAARTAARQRADDSVVHVHRPGDRARRPVRARGAGAEHPGAARSRSRCTTSIARSPTARSAASSRSTCTITATGSSARRSSRVTPAR